MPMMKSVLGLDVGSHSVKAVELRQTFRGLEPVQMRIHPRVDPEAPEAESLRRFIRMHNFPTEQIACAIPGDRLSTRQLEFPFRDRKKLSAAIPFEVEGMIPFVGPDLFRQTVARLAELNDNHLRATGLAIMAVGLIMLFVVR